VKTLPLKKKERKIKEKRKKTGQKVPLLI